MRGVVDYVLNGEIKGWVVSGGYPVCVELHKNNQRLISSASSLLESADGKIFFTIKCNEVSLGSIVSGDFEVVAFFNSGCSGEKTVLPLWWLLKLADSLLNLNSRQVSSLNRWLPLLSVNRQLILKDGAGVYCFGCVSPDGDAIVGRNGFYFLGRGSNKVIELYENSFPDVARRWEVLFSSRDDWSRSIGVEYIQLVVPEKSSVYYCYTPFKCSGVSVLFDELQKKMQGRANFIFPFVTEVKAGEVFLKVDSHLSTFGALCVVMDLVKKFDFDFDMLKFSVVKKLVSGDLGRKFEGDHRELIDVVEKIYFKDCELIPELIKSNDPKEGGHKGICRVWRCSAAPIVKKVVVFGNSFFERGVLSNQLSWWLSRIFSEFHFVWSPGFDGCYVSECAPDVVIGQTIERFLRVVPEDSL